MKILVAGATGLVGSAIVPMLSSRHAIYAIARTPRPSTANVQWHGVDLAAPPESWQLPEHWDAAIYLAQSNGYRGFPDTAGDLMAVNVAAPIALLDASRRRGARAFVLASTANVYAMAHGLIDERGAVDPGNFYARTRRVAELLAEPFAGHLAVSVARLFTIYGPGQRAGTLMASLIDRISHGQPVQVQGERGLLLSPLYVSDAAAALVRLVEGSSAGDRNFALVNVAGSEAVGIAEIATAIGSAVGRQPVIERTAGPDPGGWAGDARALQALTGWRPEISLVQGLHRTVAARPS